MAKKSANNDLQNSTQKTKTWATRTPQFSWLFVTHIFHNGYQSHGGERNTFFLVQ
jgi:hypothetical protein